MKRVRAIPRIDPCNADRCRTQFIQAAGRTLRIPRHIKRLDTRSTAGWQVTFDKPSRYFGDNGHGGAAAALRAACQYLRKIYRPEPKDTGRGLNRKTGQRTDCIRLVSKTMANQRVYWYVEASHPARNVPARRFFVGTNQTMTQARLQRARRKALAQRRSWVSEYPVPVR